MSSQDCISDADLGRLLEGNITSQKRQSLQKHIELCPDCRNRWQRVSAGAQHVESLLSAATGKPPLARGCLSEDVLAGFINQTLGPEKRHAAEEHLAQCSHCREALADRFSDVYAKEGDTWWSEYVGRQVLSLIAKLPVGEVDKILETLKVTSIRPVRSQAVIKLPVLEPAESETRRLAAATGEGFSVQTLQQDEPPFEFELVQFGEQVRIIARPLEEDSPYKNCLARLQLFERESCRWSRVVLVDNGEGQCVIEPADTRELRLQQGRLAMKLEPLVTLDQLASAGSEAYMPILNRISKHTDPAVRRAAVEVIARLYGPQARSLIEPLANDDDETVRLAAKKALNQFPERSDKK